MQRQSETIIQVDLYGIIVHWFDQGKFIEVHFGEEKQGIMGATVTPCTLSLLE